MYDSVLPCALSSNYFSTQVHNTSCHNDKKNHCKEARNPMQIWRTEKSVRSRHAIKISNLSMHKKCQNHKRNVTSQTKDELVRNARARQHSQKCWKNPITNTKLLHITFNLLRVRVSCEHCLRVSHWMDTNTLAIGFKFLSVFSFCGLRFRFCHSAVFYFCHLVLWLPERVYFAV